jgi:NADH-quinone oxidoreductase subunit J
MSPATFIVLAIALVASAITVVVHPSPVKSAMALVGTLFLLAVEFVFLDAHMIAALQVIVYAGAIMVLFLFVIMLLNLTNDGAETETRHRGGGLIRLGAWIGGGILAGELVMLFLRVPFPEPAAPPAGYGGVESVSTTLFVDWALPFELTSILLLVAVVGAVVLAQRRGA